MKPMHILYLHQYFRTRSDIGGTRSYEFARYMVDRGHRVTMVTAQDGPTWDEPDYIRRREVDGIEVVEVRAGYADAVEATKFAYRKRIAAFAAFAGRSSMAVRRLPRPDLVFATSTPLTIGIPGMVASRKHGVPLVFEVRDLWPEAPIQMGALRNPVSIAVARKLEHTIYRSSAHVVALSPGMRDGVVAAGVAPERVSVIPNASDLQLFTPEVDGSEFRRKWGVGDRLVCTYFGTMGEANDLTQVVGAARILQEQGNRDVVFVLHGDGKRRQALEASCRDQGLQNVVFSDPIRDKSAVARIAAASDVCMTIYKNVPVLYTCSPNKLFDTFSAGRAAIVNSPGWLKSLVEENEAGVYVREGDAAHLADRAAYLAANRDLVARYGANARALAERLFDRSKLAGQLVEVFESVLAERRPSPASAS